MPEWGLVTTVKAPQAKVLAFLAWHLDLGAAHIWVCFDDPKDPAFDLVASLPQVTAIRCDDAWWAKGNARPDRHQNRQARNAQSILKRCPYPWLGHIDIDEFLQPDQDISDILGALPKHQVMARMEPFEALHDPNLPSDIFTARHFRAALKPRFAALRAEILGQYAQILPEAMLSHSVGKVFFRTNVSGLMPRLHGAFIAGERLVGPPFETKLRLLHFHAQERATWTKALPFRLTKGAYQYHPQLQDFLTQASPAEIDDFYNTTQMAGPEKRAVLTKAGRLTEANLNLRARLRAKAWPTEE